MGALHSGVNMAESCTEEEILTTTWYEVEIREARIDVLIFEREAVDVHVDMSFGSSLQLSRCGK